MKLAPEDVQEYRFVVVKGTKPGSQVSFAGGLRTIRIGRGVDNDVVINDPTVSRLHARVEIRSDGWFLADNGSSAGVEKMGFRLGNQPEPLDSGDEFRLGDTILRFEVVARKGAVKAAAAREAAQKAGAGAAGSSGMEAALARFGLGTRRKQLVALGLVVVLLGILSWPAPEGLPPQRSAIPLAINYNTLAGFVGSERSHLDGAVFDVPTDSEGLGIFFQLVGLSGVEIRMGKRAVARLEPSRRWQDYELLVLPSALRGSKPRLVFDNLGYAASQGDVDPATVKAWGVKRLWVTRMSDTASSPGQLAEEVRALGELEERVGDKVGNRYALAKGLRRALIGLMKVSGQTAILVPIPLPDQLEARGVSSMLEAARLDLEAERPEKAIDKIVTALGRTEGALARDYRQQMNFFELARKKKDAAQLITALATVVQLIPEPTDPRYQVANAHVGKLGRKSRERFNQAREQIAPALKE